ncbi:MAG: hypothetical protein KAJ19_14845, partial [Gammaproteobacteria bacterium]|nr:hypothetical protein [Gammaproteobacteria bacterium]
EIDPESPYTTTLATKIRDNPVSQGEGDSSVPVVQRNVKHLLQEETVISGTPQVVDFDNISDSTYDVYMFELIGVLPTSDAETVSFFVGTGGSPTYQTGNNYSVSAGLANNTTVNTGALVGNAAADGGVNGEIFIYNPSSAVSNCQFQMQVQWIDNSATPDVRGLVSLCFYEATTAVTSFRFDAAGTNTFASGTIRLYGISN